MTTRRCYHASAAHKKYELSCEQFDQLMREADDRCQACGGITKGPSGRYGLTIDHDSSLGYWAVRGILCVSCNTRLGFPDEMDEQLDTYLANPWHLTSGVKQRPPVPAPDLPIVSLEAAEEAVRAAARSLRVAGDADMAVRDARHRLRYAVRIAIKSGMRPTAVSRATDGMWTKDQVYAACFERGRRIVQGPPRAGWTKRAA